MTATCPSCVLCSTEREATHGYVCTPHYERVAQWLHEIEVEAAILSVAKSMQQSSGNRGASLASERSPARLEAIALRDARTVTGGPGCEGPVCDYCWHDTCRAYRPGREALENGTAGWVSILDVLGSWAAMVREERKLTPPPGRATVVSERKTLTAQWEWICGQPWVDELVGALRTLRAQLKAANGTAEEKPYGRCYLLAADGGEGLCRGPIWLDLAEGHAHCGKCRQTWDGPQLVLLKAQLDHEREEAARPKTEDGRRMLTAQELADRWNTSVHNVRKMASRQGIRAVLGHYDPDRFRESRCTA